MMTILSARYANAEHTAAVIQTVENGAVAISECDTPALWSQILAMDRVDEYVAPLTIEAFTPAQIVAAIKAIDPVKALALIEATDELTYAEFITATAIPENHPYLVAGL